MRRILSIILVLFFGLGPLSAMAPGSDEMNLPPCCRRHGAHHCAMAAHMAAQMAAMTAQIAADGRQSIGAPLTCPLYPGPTIAVLMPAHALLALPAALPAPRTSAGAFVPLLITAFSAPSNAYAGRGPPISLPS